MDETKNLTTELRGLSNATYPEIFKRFQALAEEYGDMPAGEEHDAGTEDQGCVEPVLL